MGNNYESIAEALGRGMSEKEAANYVGMSVSSLASRRYRELPPRYIRIGSKIRYMKEDLDEWLKLLVTPVNPRNRDRAACRGKKNSTETANMEAKNGR